MTASRYPLAWPEGWPRSKYQRPAAFQVTLDRALAELQREIRTMGGSYPIISSNMLLRKNGEMIRDQDEPEDKGVAVYFELDAKQKVFACDTFLTVRSNVRAIGLTIGALRSIERYGTSSMMERALNAFTALPPPLDPWQILGIPRYASRETIENAYRELALAHHPDRGGSTSKMAELNRAREEALKDNEQ